MILFILCTFGIWFVTIPPKNTSVNKYHGIRVRLRIGSVYLLFFQEFDL